MHTLSLFPSLFTFGILAPTILRIVVSIFLIKNGLKKYKQDGEQWLSLIYIIFGSMILVGLYTQIVAILAIVSLKTDWWLNRKTNPMSGDKLMIYIFAGAILLSLLVTGPGILAFDLPF